MGRPGAQKVSYSWEGCRVHCDPVKERGDFSSVDDVPLPSYEAALLCIPDETKLRTIKYLLEQGKHVLVEKPLKAEKDEELVNLRKLPEKRISSVTPPLTTALNRISSRCVMHISSTNSARFTGSVYFTATVQRRM